MPKKRVLILIMCLAVLIAGFSRTVTSATAPYQASDGTFKTPEEAITSYLEGVAQGDIGKIWQACAINEISTKFKFDLYIERAGAFTPFQSYTPADYPFYVELNKAQISAQISNQVRILAYSLLSSESVSDGTTIIMDAERAKNFVNDVDPSKLAQLQVRKIGLPGKTLMYSDRYGKTRPNLRESMEPMNQPNAWPCSHSVRITTIWVLRFCAMERTGKSVAKILRSRTRAHWERPKKRL